MRCRKVSMTSVMRELTVDTNNIWPSKSISANTLITFGIDKHRNGARKSRSRPGRFRKAGRDSAIAGKEDNSCMAESIMEPSR